MAALSTTACSSSKQSDIVATAVEAGSFNTLVAAVKAADLVGTLKGDGPFTVFAPTDAAFGKLPAGTLDELLKFPFICREEGSGAREVIAEHLGGRLINDSPRGSEEQRLLNIVEEMALASGTTMPAVYVLPEDAINAFAAGLRARAEVRAAAEGRDGRTGPARGPRAAARAPAPAPAARRDRRARAARRGRC